MLQPPLLAVILIIPATGIVVLIVIVLTETAAHFAAVLAAAHPAVGHRRRGAALFRVFAVADRAFAGVACRHQPLLLAFRVGTEIAERVMRVMRVVDGGVVVTGLRVERPFGRTPAPFRAPQRRVFHVVRAAAHAAAVRVPVFAGVAGVAAVRRAARRSLVFLPVAAQTEMHRAFRSGHSTP